MSKTKNLNLDQTWELCLEMWKWVIETSGDKHIWLEQNGYDNMYCSCFFCEFASKSSTHNGPMRMTLCPLCPGKAVDPSFHCEEDVPYSWCDNPEDFYKKLVELNNKRLGK